MKLTAAEIKRLLELMAKAAGTLSDTEKSELAALQAKAAAATDDDGEVTETQLTSIIENAVKGVAANGLNEAQVKSIVDSAIKGIKIDPGVDANAITEAVTKSVKEAIPVGLTADAVEGIVTKALKNSRSKSRFEHDEGENVEIDLPLSERKGNLPVDAKQLLNVMTKGTGFINDGISDTQLADARRRGMAAEQRTMASLKRLGVNAAIQHKGLTTTGSGTGAEFMNQELSSTVLSRMYLDSLVAAAMTANEIQMPTDNFEYPLSTTLPEFKTGAENEDADDSTPGTGSLVLAAKKLIGRVNFSYEAEEDSIIAILPLILAQLSEAGAMALEDAIINGDLAGTHQDSDTHAIPKHAAKRFDGIRKLALAQASLKVSLATGGISKDNVLAMKKALKRWGLNPKNCLIIAGVNGYNDLVGLPETLTAEKTGNAATARILTGLAPNLLGMDIVPSAKIREDLNANGVYDGTTTTKGSLIIIHKPSWIMGVRRGFTVEQDKDISAQKKWVVASYRRAFHPIESLANTKAAVVGYNYNS